MADKEPTILQPEFRDAAGTLVSSTLWAEFKRILMVRRPSFASPNTDALTSVAYANLRAGYEKCISDIEALPFDLNTEDKSPFVRPALDPTD